MKRYIKPETTLFKAEGEQILAAVSSNPSLNTTPGGSMDPWGGQQSPISQKVSSISLGTTKKRKKETTKVLI